MALLARIERYVTAIGQTGAYGGEDWANGVRGSLTYIVVTVLNKESYTLAVKRSTMQRCSESVLASGHIL